VDGELPAADPRRVGSLVHRVLDRVARESLGDPVESLAEASKGPGVAIAWPPPDALEAIACEEAREMLREEGVALPGFERVLALAARDPLALAREIDAAEAGAGSRIAGAEVECRLGVRDASGAARELRLRIDRVELLGDSLRLTDFKTGRPKLSQSGDAKRRAALLAAVGSGALLQAPAYAAAARAHGAPRGIGRHLHLHPGATERTRELCVDAADAELTQVFDAAVAVALAAWDAGSFFPRLLEAASERENEACSRCTLKEACVRGDSAARGRLGRWAAHPPAAPSPAEAALLGLWRPEQP
jgi:hypothetical protein